jgi:hypothetical protein
MKYDLDWYEVNSILKKVMELRGAPLRFGRAGVSWPMMPVLSISPVHGSRNRSVSEG